MRGWVIKAKQSFENENDLKVLNELHGRTQRLNELTIDASGWKDIPSSSFEKICGFIEECQYDKLTLLLRDSCITAQQLQVLSVAISLNNNLESIGLNLTNCEGVGDIVSMKLISTAYSLNSNIHSIHLGLRYCKQMTNDSIFWLSESITNNMRMLSLDFEYCFSLSDRSLDILSCLITRCTQLETLKLNLNGCSISDEGINALCSAISLISLKEFSLSISSCEDVTGLGLNIIAKCLNNVKDLRVHIGFSNKINDEDVGKFLENLDPQVGKNDSTLLLEMDSMELISSENLLRNLWKCSIRHSKELSKICLSVSRCKGFVNALKVVQMCIEEFDQCNQAKIELDLFNQQIQQNIQASNTINIANPIDFKVLIHSNINQIEAMRIFKEDSRVAVLVGEYSDYHLERNEDSLKITIIKFTQQIQNGQVVVGLIEFEENIQSSQILQINLNLENENQNNEQKIVISGESDSNLNLFREIEKQMRIIAKETNLTNPIQKVVFEVFGDYVYLNGQQIKIILDGLRWFGLIKQIEFTSNQNSIITDEGMNEISKAILQKQDQVTEWRLLFRDCQRLSDVALIEFVGRIKQMEQGKIHATFGDCKQITDLAIGKFGSVIKGDNSNKIVHIKFMNALKITDQGLDEVLNLGENILAPKNTELEMMFVLCPQLSIKKIVMLQKYLKEHNKNKYMDEINS